MFTVTVTAQADAWTPEVPGGGPRRRERAMRSPGRRAQRSPHDGDRERGTITLMLLVMFVALLALAGIVIDGGAKLDQAENANAIAQEAARAGGPGNGSPRRQGAAAADHPGRRPADRAVPPGRRPAAPPHAVLAPRQHAPAAS